MNGDTGSTSKKPSASTAELLDQLDTDEGGERVSAGEVADLVGGRAHGLVLFVLSLPEMIPVVGLSLILAAPIFVLGVALIWKGANPPIPEWVRKRSMKRSSLRTTIRRTRRVVRWLDRISKPRWRGLAGAGRLQGVICVIMAILLAVPIPGVNILAAAAVGSTGAGILQRDGKLVAASMVLACAALLGVMVLVTGVLT